MTQTDLIRAKKVVENFRESLADNASAEINEKDYERLTLLIQEALQDDRKEVAGMIEEVLKTLHKEIDIPEIGM